MEICLIDIDKKEKFKEIEFPMESKNPSIMQVKDCYKIDSEGLKVPIFIPKMGGKATMELCDYVFAKYKNDINE